MIGNRLRFRLITIASDEDMFHVVERGMRDAATALNVDADLVGTPGFDTEDVIRMVRSAVQDGIDDGAPRHLLPMANTSLSPCTTTAWGHWRSERPGSHQ